MKSLLLVGTTLISIPLLIILNLVYLSYLGNLKNSQALSKENNKIAYAASPSTQNLLSDRVEPEDARIGSLKEFLEKYKSELLPFTQNIIDSSDRYELDYRLIPAIAMQESNLCKKAPKNSYNCWGFGIYGKTFTKFDNYPDAIETVAKTLAKEYKEKGLVEPEEIMTKYTPSNNGGWARSVSYFMQKLPEYYPIVRDLTNL